MVLVAPIRGEGTENIPIVAELDPSPKGTWKPMCLKPGLFFLPVKLYMKRKAEVLTPSA